MPNDKLPETRVNLTYRDATDGARAERELPFRMLVVGDFSAGQNPRELCDRRPLDVDPGNFDDRLAEMDLSIELSVPDRLSGEDGAQMAVSLRVRSLDDFAPHRVVEQVASLRRLRELREALEQLKTAFLNEKDFRRRLADLLQDPAKVEAVLAGIRA